jgi:hypothetical protein
MSSHDRSRRVLVRVAGMLGAIALMAPATVAARTAVDPTTLTPPPPDFFNADCNVGAGGVLCTLHFSDDPVVDEPSGILCGSTELLVSQTRSVIGKRTYDAAGLLLQRHFREELAGTLTNPVTGRSVPWTQHDTVIHDLSVPGDLDSGTTMITGLTSRFFLPGGGTVLVDAGTTVHDAAGALVKEGGPHPLVDYFELGDGDALGPICDAVG